MPIFDCPQCDEPYRGPLTGGPDLCPRCEAEAEALRQDAGMTENPNECPADGAL